MISLLGVAIGLIRVRAIGVWLILGRKHERQDRGSTAENSIERSRIPREPG